MVYDHVLNRDGKRGMPSLRTRPVDRIIVKYWSAKGAKSRTKKGILVGEDSKSGALPKSEEWAVG